MDKPQVKQGKPGREPSTQPRAIPQRRTTATPQQLATERARMNAVIEAESYVNGDDVSDKLRIGIDGSNPRVAYAVGSAAAERAEAQTQAQMQQASSAAQARMQQASSGTNSSTYNRVRGYLEQHPRVTNFLQEHPSVLNTLEAVGQLGNTEVSVQPNTPGKERTSNRQ